MEFQKSINIIFFVSLISYLSLLYCLVSAFGLIYVAVMVMFFFAHHSVADSPE